MAVNEKRIVVDIFTYYYLRFFLESIIEFTVEVWVMVAYCKLFKIVKGVSGQFKYILITL